MRYYERERREFIRIKVELPVTYHLLSHDSSFEPPEPLKGLTKDISGGGILLEGPLADTDWIPGLLTERIYIGVEVDLSQLPEIDVELNKPLKALTRAAWVETAPKGESNCRMGLRFQEIVQEDLDRIFSFVINKNIT